ncbi:thiol-disulfide oxidoreductase DCC family protein [Demequina oxidasica]|uniref:thiol-disulfide oxidoreductase DCC family protein n=1 Tax=Demequina oxidasica TaxID=676199 RepID=UPI000780CFE2|nr:DCC1-like thiol-disulfide oxidoreductase family protein [Demequina oxidasica]
MARIVVFDGECGLCNGFVSWLVRHDRGGAFLLAGSAGEVGRETIRRAGLPADIGASTTVLWDSGSSPDNAAGNDGGAVPGNAGHVLTKSDAVIAILRGLGWPWRAATLARIVPRSWRDRVYDAVAARRSRVNAEDPACGVPPRELVTLWKSRLATLDDLA